jgi:hypothetical protein
MEGTQRVATWLELAAAPVLGREDCPVKLHPLGGEEGRCFALSMDGRWVCAGNGDLTVFKGLGAALYFLEVLHVEAFVPGERASQVDPCDGGHHCLMVDRHKGLLPCRPCAPTRSRARDQPH